MFIAKKVLLLGLLCLGASLRAADTNTVDDAIKLSASGVGEEVIAAWAEQQHGFRATAENIIALKDHKVSDKVILSLMKGSENAPLNVAPLSGKTVEDRGWLRRTGDAAPRAQYAADEPVVSAPSTTYVAPSTSYVVPSTTYVVQPAVTYVDYSYPYYRSCGYPYYSSCGYYGCGYPYYGYGYPYYGYGYGNGLSLNFSFGHSHGYYGGYNGGYGGYGGGYYGGGYYGGGYRSGYGGGGFRGTGYVSGGFRGRR